ncbi:hypothetical protein UFOVP315_22 [uncultured Caudovirales phage]|uniref:HTH_XRE domain containing protein n=1 Tax=uncultured Caudovirales phage TaxID=2100421 RepID=A0A6J5LR24_9CAUD|nr:hypothetical protein UFOVP315_22 [uncultured Caudovirales phage]
MSKHPVCEVWQHLLVASGLRAVDLCRAVGLADAQFSRYMHGKLWPSRNMARRINRGFELLLNRAEGSVDKLVDRLWVTGGKVTAGMVADSVGHLYPQVIPVVVRRPQGVKKPAPLKGR